MHHRLTGALMLAIVATTGPATALTVTNRDDVARKLTIFEGDKLGVHVLQPAQLLENVCQKGCIVRLDDNTDPDEDYELEGDEHVTIEDGALYHDDRPPPGVGAQSSPPQGTPATTPAPAPTPKAPPPPEKR
jgi:hypothetical protein